MAPNFVLAAVAALLLYSGYKGASLKSTLTGGEADQSSEGGSSGGGNPSTEVGGAGTVAGGSPSHPLATNSEAEAAAHSPYGTAPAPSSIKLPASTKQKIKQVRAALTLKQNLSKLVTEKRMSKTAAQSAFNQKYPHYAKEANEVVALGKAAGK